jgi:hypothetical protein
MEDPLEPLDMCAAALHDAAMIALGSALEALPPLDELDNRCLAVFALCSVSIKKSFSASTSVKEAWLAYRTVRLLALTLRAGASDLLPMVFPLLSKMLRVQVSHDNTSNLVAALDCLTTVAFAGAVDTKDFDLSMKAIWAVISPSASGFTKLVTTTQLLVAAVSTWTFVATVVEITPAQLRTDRTTWNANFASRQIKSFLIYGECHEEKVRMQLVSSRQVITVSTWVKQFQLHFLEIPRRRLPQAYPGQ